MSVLQIVELVVLGVLMVAHVISNFYNARCSCKLCSVARLLLGKSDDVQQAEDPNLELFRSFCEWLENQKK